MYNKIGDKRISTYVWQFAKQSQESTPASTATPQASTPPTHPAAPAEKKDYTETRLQVKIVQYTVYRKL